MFWRRLPGAIRGVEAGTPGASPRRSVCAALTRRLWTLSCSCQVQQRPFSRAPPPEAAETPLTTRGRRRHETRLPAAECRAARRSGAAERGGARVSVRLAFLSNVKSFTWNQLQGATPPICDETQRPAKPGGGAAGGGAAGGGACTSTGGSKHWWTGRRPLG